MTTGRIMTLPSACDVAAPDGSEVRLLLSLSGGSMAHFLLPAGQVARAVRHRSVEEIWYVLSGAGEMWQSDTDQILPLLPGVCLTIPVGISFQFRSSGPDALAAVAVTMPPWPGDAEAELVPGPWTPSV